MLGETLAAISLLCVFWFGSALCTTRLLCLELTILTWQSYAAYPASIPERSCSTSEQTKYWCVSREAYYLDSHLSKLQCQIWQTCPSAAWHGFFRTTILCLSFAMSPIWVSETPSVSPDHGPVHLLALGVVSCKSQPRDDPDGSSWLNIKMAHSQTLWNSGCDRITWATATTDQLVSGWTWNLTYDSGLDSLAYQKWVTWQWATGMVNMKLTCADYRAMKAVDSLCTWFKNHLFCSKTIQLIT